MANTPMTGSPADPRRIARLKAAAMAKTSDPRKIARNMVALKHQQAAIASGNTKSFGTGEAIRPFSRAPKSGYVSVPKKAAKTTISAKGAPAPKASVSTPKASPAPKIATANTESSVTPRKVSVTPRSAGATAPTSQKSEKPRMSNLTAAGLGAAAAVALPKITEKIGEKIVERILREPLKTPKTSGGVIALPGGKQQLRLPASAGSAVRVAKGSAINLGAGRSVEIPVAGRVVSKKPLKTAGTISQAPPVRQTVNTAIKNYEANAAAAPKKMSGEIVSTTAPVKATPEGISSTPQVMKQQETSKPAASQPIVQKNIPIKIPSPSSSSQVKPPAISTPPVAKAPDVIKPAVVNAKSTPDTPTTVVGKISGTIGKISTPAPAVASVSPDLKAQLEAARAENAALKKGAGDVPVSTDKPKSEAPATKPPLRKGTGKVYRTKLGHLTTLTPKEYEASVNTSNAAQAPATTSVSPELKAQLEAAKAENAALKKGAGSVSTLGEAPEPRTLPAKPPAKGSDIFDAPSRNPGRMKNTEKILLRERIAAAIASPSQSLQSKAQAQQNELRKRMIESFMVKNPEKTIFGGKEGGAEGYKKSESVAKRIVEGFSKKGSMSRVFGSYQKGFAKHLPDAKYALPLAVGLGGATAASKAYAEGAGVKKAAKIGGEETLKGAAAASVYQAGSKGLKALGSYKTGGGTFARKGVNAAIARAGARALSGLSGIGTGIALVGAAKDIYDVGKAGYGAFQAVREAKKVEAASQRFQKKRLAEVRAKGLKVKV